MSCSASARGTSSALAQAQDLSRPAHNYRQPKQTGGSLLKGRWFHTGRNRERVRVGVELLGAPCLDRAWYVRPRASVVN